MAKTIRNRDIDQQSDSDKDSSNYQVSPLALKMNNSFDYIESRDEKIVKI